MEKTFSTPMIAPGMDALACKRRPLSRGRRWLFRLMVVLALLALAEAGSYFTYWAASGHRFSYADIHQQQETLVAGLVNEKHPLNPHLRTQIHPYIGFVYNPYCKRFILPGENPATLWGFTDREGRSPVRKRAANKVLVGITGGSAASIFAGIGAEALIRELRSLPAFAGKEIEVFSLSVGGFKQPQQLMALEYVLALGGELDILINLDGFNEVAWPEMNLTSGVHHLFPPGWPWIISRLPDPVIRRSVGKIAYLADRRSDWARAFLHAPLRWSITAALVWKLRDRGMDQEQVEMERTLLAHGKPENALQSSGPPNDFHGEADMMNKLVGDWERSSQLIADVCRARGIRYYHFLQPNQYVPGSKPLNAEERKTAYNPDMETRHFVEVGYPLLRAAGRRLTQAGVSFHDLSMLFAGIADTLYIDTCCHFNRSGNDRVAAAMARAILETPEPPRAREQ